MPAVVWLFAKVYPKAPFFVPIFLNSIVHVVMYTYYTMAAAGYNTLWWKKYVTLTQLVQFLLIFVQFCIIVPQNCAPNYPIASFLSASFTLTFLIYLIYSFSKFYYDNYIAMNKPLTPSKARSKCDLNGNIRKIN